MIRPFNLYGPGQDGRFLIPSIARQVADPACTKITVNDLRPKRDYLHVADLVRLIGAAIRAGVSGVFNAGSGRSISAGDLIAEMSAVAGVHKPIEATGETRAGDVLDVVADATKAAQELAWRPQITLQQGLAGIVAWSREHFA